MTACLAPTLPQAKTACAWSPHTSRLHTLPCMTRARLCDRSRLTVRHSTVYSVAICCHIDHICGLILQNDCTPLLPYVASLLRCLCLLPYPAISAIRPCHRLSSLSLPFVHVTAFSPPFVLFAAFRRHSSPLGSRILVPAAASSLHGQRSVEMPTDGQEAR